MGRRGFFTEEICTLIISGSTKNIHSVVNKHLSPVTVSPRPVLVKKGESVMEEGRVLSNRRELREQALKESCDRLSGACCAKLVEGFLSSAGDRHFRIKENLIE